MPANRVLQNFDFEKPEKRDQICAGNIGKSRQARESLNMDYYIH